jgi:hypothetical protein
MGRREELADELTAILGASRELTPDTDRFLAERFVDQLDNRTLETSRRRRSISRRARTPRRQITALLVTALALAIGAPISLQAIRTHEQSYSVPCSWQPQTLLFDSRSAEATWQRVVNPKSYHIAGSRFDANGKVTIQASHWECG